MRALCINMNSVPENIDFDSLAGPKRGKGVTQYFQDEIVYSPSGKYFALAYTIAEASMCNDVGCIAWGEMSGSDAIIMVNPEGVYASCWRSPWCIWLSDEEFMFKAQIRTESGANTPNVVISHEEGVAIVPNSNSPEWWCTAPSTTSLRYQRYTNRTLKSLVKNA